MSPLCYGNGGENLGGLGFSTDAGFTWNTIKTNGSMFGTFILDAYSG
jgi:hypothetical protein